MKRAFYFPFLLLAPLLTAYLPVDDRDAAARLAQSMVQRMQSKLDKLGDVDEPRASKPALGQALIDELFGGESSAYVYNTFNPDGDMETNIPVSRYVRDIWVSYPEGCRVTLTFKEVVGAVKTDASGYEYVEVKVNHRVRGKFLGLKQQDQNWDLYWKVSFDRASGGSFANGQVRSIQKDPEAGGTSLSDAPPPGGGGSADVPEGSYTETVNGVSFQMTFVEGGTFQMGCTEGTGCEGDELPLHEVSLTDFWMGQTEVTQELWRSVMGGNPSENAGCDRCPVEQVSYDDAQEFIQRLNSMTQHTYAMPTEAEWEFAARGGNNARRTRYAGGDDLDEVAWYASNAEDVGRKTQPVGGKKPNELGLYDMSGNVAELVSDLHEEDYYSASPRRDPTGPTSGDTRICRGGAWDKDPRHNTVYGRFTISGASAQYDYMGFRLRRTKGVGGGTVRVNPTDLPASYTERVNGASFEMKLVEGGTFGMGCDESDPSLCESDERPVHNVTLNTYYMAETEVTQELWQAVMGSNPSANSGCSRCPVEQVSLYDAQQFVRKLSESTGRSYAVPTEAEWEFAARGGNNARKTRYAGSDDVDEVSWYSANADNLGLLTQPVAQKRPNELGLYDMSGNVAEWVTDFYASEYYSVSPSQNPTGPPTGTTRICKGGGYDDGAEHSVVYGRFTVTNASSSYGYIGFRVRALPPGVEPAVAGGGGGGAFDPVDLPEGSFTETVNGVEFRMAFVQGGTFRMGCDPSRGEVCSGDDKPAHNVTVSDYCLGQTEVTQELWQAVMGSNPSESQSSQFAPVEMVSYNQIQTFITRLNRLSSHRYSLPTEAEWEYAARGGNRSQGYVFAGSNDLEEVAWYSGNAEAMGLPPQPVGGKKPNELGLYDMSGNVAEWVADYYSRDYYYRSPNQNPTGPTAGPVRIVRGGGWDDGPEVALVYARFSVSNGDARHNYMGFRLRAEPASGSGRASVAPSSDLPGRNFTETAKGVDFDMVFVEGGDFTMGCTSEQGPNCDARERPAHRVTVPSFYIGKTEVTQRLWVAVMGSNPAAFPGCDRCPIENVNWADAQEFIAKLNRMTGKAYLLPTEAQWEYAARGGKQSRGYKFAGSDNASEVAWFLEGSYQESSTQPVATKKPNELGLYDMSGNVSEWCSDWFGEDYYSRSPTYNPTGPPSGEYHIIRVGSWSRTAEDSRVSMRSYHGTRPINQVGFRLALMAE